MRLLTRLFKTNSVRILAGLLVATSLVAGGTLTGCSGNSTAAPVSLKKIVVGQPGGYGLSWMPVYLASTLGYFKEQGLDVSFVNYAGGPLVISAMVAGNTQFSLTGYEQTLNVYEQGQATTMFIATVKQMPWSFVVTPDIKTPADLKGKVISGGLAGSSPRAFVRACVKAAGLDPDKDVTYINVPSNGIAAALIAGQASACLAGDVNKIMLLSLGNKLMFDMSDPAVDQKVLGSQTYHEYVVSATDDYIKNNPETVQAFTTAVVEAMKWMNSHHPDEIADQLLPLFQMDKSVLIGGIADALKTISTDGYFTQQGHDAAVKVSLSVGMITKPVDFNAVATNSFLKTAWDKVGK